MNIKLQILVNHMKFQNEGYSLDQIKMTEWIWPNHDNDKP